MKHIEIDAAATRTASASTVTMTRRGIGSVFMDWLKQRR